MKTINAIAKVRFASARPQRVQLSQDAELTVELVCMEAGQAMEVRGGHWNYYVIAGSGQIAGDGTGEPLVAGQLTVLDAGERHVLTNTGEARLILLAAGRH